MNFFSHRFFWLLSGLCVALVLCIGGWSLIEKKEKNAAAAFAGRSLRVGLEKHYPPFAMQDAHGEHTGFDYDISVALCEILKAKCEFVVQPFDDALAAMMNGELDMMITGLAALDERKQKMDFTDPYYRSRTVYVGKQGLTISDDGLRGKKIGAQEGSMQLAYAYKRWDNIATIVAASYDEVTARLLAGEVDVVLVDGLAGYGLLKSEQGIGLDLLGEPLEIDNVLSNACIGVRKGDTALTQALNDAIIFLRLTGEYDRINRKYFSFSIY